jgi:hypothetical protein
VNELFWGVVGRNVALQDIVQIRQPNAFLRRFAREVLPNASLNRSRQKYFSVGGMGAGRKGFSRCKPGSLNLPVGQGLRPATPLQLQKG